MFLEIIPFDTSIDNEGLTYFIKDELGKSVSIGSIVLIPIRNKLSYGVISKKNVELMQDPKNIKSIVQIVCSIPILDEYQIKTIYDLSAKYFVHIHKILNLFLPKFIFDRLEKNSFVDLEYTKTKKSTKKERKIIFNKNHTLQKILSDIIEENKKIVLIFPDDNMIEDFQELNKKLEKKSIIYKNKSSSTKKAKIFTQIYNQEKNIVIGTRKILTYNLIKYDKIIYIEDAFGKYIYSFEHKYKNSDLLDFIGKNSDFDIDIISSIPLVNTIYKSMSEKWKMINK